MSLFSKFFTTKDHIVTSVAHQIERRNASRFRDGQHTMLFTPNGASTEVEIVESNGDGLRLSSPLPLQEGKRHTVIINFRGRNFRFFVEGLWSRKTTAGGYHCGARIVALTETDRMHQVSYRHFLSRNPLVA